MNRFSDNKFKLKSLCLLNNMKQQDYTYFGEELEEITPRIIPTSYGDIYSLTAGMPGQPLIIVVHGSGPKNSADQYAYLLHQYLVRVSYLEKFYLVAIDCPGYGRSKGSKEAIKTFPLQMFREILQTLKYKNYFAMLGHSQGGAAIFNAVHQDPTIAQCLVMDRPVCGNIQRFRKFSMPTLLIYDIQDDGHPIWQGKLLFKELKNTQFYTYRASHHPYWVPDNIWEKMLSFFSKLHKEDRKVHIDLGGERKNKSYSKPKSTSKPKKKKNISMDRMREIKKTEAKQLELLEIQEVQRSELMSMSSADRFSQYSFEEKPQIKREQNSERSSNEEREALLNPPKKIEEKPAKSIEERTQIKKEEIRGPKIEEAPVQQSVPVQQPVPIQQPTEVKPAMSLQQLQQEHRCAICYQILYRPMTTNCNHSFCNKCLIQSLLVNEKCPLCRGKITKKTENVLLHHKILEQMSKKDVARREQDFQKVQRMMKSIVYVEIGNTSRQLETKQSAFTKTKKKYNWEVFVKQPKNFGIQEVGFNINMGDPTSKPIKVRNSPFTFESRGTFSFACEISIKPRNSEYAQRKEIYRIDVEPGYHSKKIALRKKCYQAS